MSSTDSEINVQDPIAGAIDTENTTEGLILGKFNNQEDLIKSYRALESSFSSKENFEKKYNQIQEERKVPDEYEAKGDLLSHSEEELRSLAEEAKTLNLTQEQFDVFASNRVQTPVQEGSTDVPKLTPVLRKYLQDNYTFSDAMLNAMGPEDISNFEKKYQSSLDTNTSIHSTVSSVKVSRDTVRELYKSMRDAERLGPTAYNEAFNKWQEASKRSRS